MKDTSNSRIGALMKWVGVLTALISLGTAIYQLAHAQGELNERRRVVREQMDAARTQSAAGDFAAAWDDLARADTGAAADGFFAKLLGGLSAERQQVRIAQQDLSMQWVRSSRVADGHRFAEITDKVSGVLASGANTASGARKADLLAHLGWAYFLKSRDGDGGVHPDTEYREAVAVDADNPYANVFWGHWILWGHGSLDSAATRFAAALSSGRARDEVRHFQLSALGNVRSEETDAAFVRVVNDMRVGDATIDADTRSAVCERYSIALHDDGYLQKLLLAVPAAQQVELIDSLLKSADLPVSQHSTLQLIKARIKDSQKSRVARVSGA
jgi:hypothetical protein